MTIPDEITVILSQQLVDYWQGVPNNVYLNKLRQSVFFVAGHIGQMNVPAVKHYKKDEKS